MEVTRKLKTFFKHKDANLDEDDGDDNLGGEYWEFIDLDDVECWSLEFILMSNWVHFVQKFKNLLAFLSISHEEKVREVRYESRKRINIHYMTTTDEPCLFTISIDYEKAPF